MKVKKNRPIGSILLLSASCLLLFFCVNESRATDTLQVQNTEVAVKKSRVVYVAGEEQNRKLNSVAKYWRNGEVVTLTNGKYDAEVHALTVSQAHVFVAGYEEKLDDSVRTPTAKIWKDKHPTAIGIGHKSSDIKALAVDKETVYAVGREGKFFRFWKNGQLVSLTDKQQKVVFTDVTVAHGDVYVSGALRNKNGILVAAYWKDGRLHVLSRGIHDAIAQKIVIDRRDVYVLGAIDRDSLNTNFVYWKDGKKTKFSDNADRRKMNDMDVEDGNIYIVGNEFDVKADNYVALLWANGTKKKMTDGSHNANARAVAVDKGDVFIAGTERNDHGTYDAKYWKNGKSVVLTSGLHNAYANDIFIAYE